MYSLEKWPVKPIANLFSHSWAIHFTLLSHTDVSMNSVWNFMSSACTSYPVARLQYTDAGTFHLSSLLRETAQPVTSAFAFLLMSTWAASASFLIILVVTESDHCCPFVLLHMCEWFSRLIPSSGTPGSWGMCTPLALPVHILCSCSIQIFVLFLLIPAKSFYS